MLTEALTALAAAGGTAVVQAAGTDAWEGFQRRVAKIFSHGNTEREGAEMKLLELTAVALESSPEDELERFRSREQDMWRTRFEALLECSDELERKRTADDLQALLAEQTVATDSVEVSLGGLTAGRDIKIRGGRGGIAAGIISGGVHMDKIVRSRPSQG